MKKTFLIKSILTFVCVVAMMTSCKKDFLNFTPTGVVSDTDLNTVEAAEKLVIAAYASLGNGSEPHLIMEMFKNAAQVDIQMVPYKITPTIYTDIALEKKGGLDDAKWFKVADILALNFYEDILPIVTKAITMLVSRK